MGRPATAPHRRLAGLRPQTGQSGGRSVADKRVDLAYYDLGRRETPSRYADLAGTALVATTVYAFDLTGSDTIRRSLVNDPEPGQADEARRFVLRQGEWGISRTRVYWRRPRMADPE